MRSRTKAWAMALTVLTLSAHSAPLPAADLTNTAAEALFQQGMKDLAKKDYAAAKKSLSMSYQIDPNLVTLVNLAKAEENLGDLVEARQHLAEAVDMARTRSDSKLPFVEERFKAVDAKVPRLVFKVPSVEGLKLVRNGLEIPSESWAKTHFVNPGKQTIEVSAPNRTSWSTVVDLRADGATRNIEIPELPWLPGHGPSAAPSASVSSSVPVTPVLPAPSPAPVSRTNVHTPISLTIAGLGIAALGVGTYFGMQAQLKYSDSGCSSNVCNPAMFETYKESRTLAQTATWLFVGGGVLAGGGLLYFALTRGSSSAVQVGMGEVSVVGRW